ncbi:GerAB/ArcD/ProY family transporter [Paenibacillus chondroitinus]|uniref:GerAB/ArcD/ProY family transporter n=1 Tax=Paenibacillus chondroitinus TaxID=59842 RepID=UPI0038996B67
MVVAYCFGLVLHLYPHVLILLFDIWVLGANMAGRSNFPLLTLVRMINIANFIQRLDPLLILTLIHWSVLQSVHLFLRWNERRC